MVIAIAIVAVGVLAAFGGDLIGTASVVETMDLSKQSLYAEQEFVSVTVKNSGTTSLNSIQAYVLIAESDTAPYSCKKGGEKASIGNSGSLTNVELAPGESITISGDLKAENGTTDIVCGTGTSVAIDDRTEYIIIVDAISEGLDIISTTTTVRSR
jgi:hypothetical protein